MECSKMFRSERNLKAHMAIHTAEKSYNCDSCGKTFRSQGGLKQHFKTTSYHGEAGNHSLLQTATTSNEGVLHEQPGNQIIIKLDKDAEHYFQLEDGQLMRAEDSFLTIKDDEGGETKVAII